MMERRFTLDELEEMTGVSRRMIRHYISQKLVPGSLERGPKAAYSEATLKRLRLITQLRKTRVEPLGRPITTGEMRTVLENVGEKGLENIAAGIPIRLFDTEAATPLSMDSASDALDRMEPEVNKEEALFFQESPAQQSAEGLESLLRGLLAEMDGAIRDSKTDATNWDRWRSADRPNLKIQLRVPRDENENYELSLLAGELRALLKKL